MTNPMLMCGHAANARLADGTPVCAICYPMVAGSDKVAPDIDLSGRIARCSYGPHADVPSSVTLAFFHHQPTKPYDEYYCGCYGWD